ncbi:Phosphatidylglycerophosphatase B [Alkalibacterium sp. AK22]|uniref:phosphatase PAP2 family protein n=1 Tax=Alkalibacterium sp. AK22 TaxID=1229520 RepID=UPI00045363D3|nr:phosphatase PAP2 family protein [Alkalibacterium sp. AK22]EXJ22981.1 Phosphatidylglycerophosphatase B [Alkalibacterium sp. AK22]
MQAKRIIQLNKWITYFVYTIYPFVLVSLSSLGDPRIWRVLLAPALSFMLVTLIRKWINAPRPYEVEGFVPAIPKETRGQSFPSRHVFSVFVIASTLYNVYRPLGLLLMLMGALLAFLRVIGGVHYPRDVIAGALIGLLSGFLGFYLF